MQIQKDNIRKQIVTFAREEFLSKGFKDVSMRKIAEKADVGLSNIYNYFKSKDEIFFEVLKPLLSALDEVLVEHNHPDNISLDIFTSNDYQMRHIQIFVNLILNYKEELRIMFFKAHGSSLENYFDDYAHRHTEIGLEYFEKMKEKYPQINDNVSEFFIHTMSSWWMSIISEIVSHDLSDEDIKRFIREYMEFGTAGWKKLMRV